MMDARITVVRVIDRMNVGGPAIHAALTTQGLDPTRFRTVLVVGSVEPGEADMSYLLDDCDVRGQVVTIPSLGRELRPLRDLRTLWQVIQVMRRERPSIVHTHKAKAGAVGRVAAFLCRVPVRVHTFHGHVLHGYFGPTKTKVFTAIERALATISDRLVTPSPALADELAQRYRVAKRERFHVVPLGFHLQPFMRAEEHRGVLRRSLGVADDVKLVGIVGRMVPVKDHATFIAAAADLAARRPDVSFVFVGGGELETEVRADIERRGLAGRAHLLGWRRDTPAIYADLDVVALSSINEGTPVTLIEAMAAGVPVVSTNVGGVGDVLQAGRRGELVPARNPALLSQAIERALAPEVRKRVAPFRPEILDEYGAGRLCRDLATLYDDLLARRTR